MERRRSNQVNALWAQVLQLPECGRVVWRWKTTIGILLPKLARMLAETAYGTQVLALHRDRIAGFEPVADAKPLARLRARRGLAG